MEDNFKPIECNDGDVFSFPGDATFKVGNFKEKVHKAFGQSVGNQFTHDLIAQKVNIDPAKLHPKGHQGTVQAWFNEGLDCEILILGSQNWKKGKIKIDVNVEFYIEEDDIEIASIEKNQPESPLDDLRRMINEETS